MKRPANLTTFAHFLKQKVCCLAEDRSHLRKEKTLQAIPHWAECDAGCQLDLGCSLLARANFPDERGNLHFFRLRCVAAFDDSAHVPADYETMNLIWPWRHHLHLLSGLPEGGSYGRFFERPSLGWLTEKCDWVRRAHWWIWWVWPQEGQLSQAVSVYIVSVVLLGSCGAKSSGYQGILSTGGDLPFRMCLQCCFGDRSMASFDLSILFYTYLYLSHLPKVSYISRAFASALRVRIRSLACTAFAWLCD